MICKGQEPKVLKTLEKFGRGFNFPYSVNADKNELELEFYAKNLSSRNEVLRRLRHLKNPDFELVSIQTKKVRDDGKL